MCRGACVKALLSLSLTPAGKTIDSFTQDMKLVKSNPELLQTFYDYVSEKYGIKCEAGVALVEKMTITNRFNE
ncbi:hypothetical protein HK407_08g13460 [Ordospora pajunii]|jgi:hypothetical protein|uniref:uncharacterized protein n=1 Tax=Ordospora pajunii TaxID=3039483 RepID=UPI0029526365|nr:uncharacterized protein HK407_08g13460 [Ordospora pajunii]KAH9411072.1 hypothetical protein HK407_08g13460 [Ordospora pajunii]